MDSTTGWRKRQINFLAPKTADEFYNELRNKVIEEVSTHIEKLKGDTPASFAVYVRDMKK